MFNLFSSKNDSSVTPQEAYEVLKNSKAILIDVREAFEVASGRAQGAKSYPLSSLSEKDAEALKKYDAVYVICQSGGRSLRATSFLKDAGVNAINVAKGTFGWSSAGLPMSR